MLIPLALTFIFHLIRHARLYAGHPRLGGRDIKDVDGRDKPGHDVKHHRGKNSSSKAVSARGAWVGRKCPPSSVSSKRPPGIFLASSAEPACGRTVSWRPATTITGQRSCGSM